MKILYKTMRLWLLAVCLCTLAATPASAKVCFVGEENCTGGGSFDDYKDPGEDGNLCKKEGFGTTAAECRNDPNKDITAYCPYNNNYVKCCGKEYVYDAPCVYPLVTKGKCGNKYKCECDSSQYKYTDHECKTTKGSAGEGYENSYGSGSFCTQQSYDSNTQKIVSEVRYSSCQCDRGIYPKFGSMFPKDPSVESDCDFNAEKEGPCSTKYANSNKTETYYKFCRCNTADYPKTDAGCYPLTGDASEGSCFDTIMHYTDCASCAGYEARNLDHVPYSPGSKAVQCQKDDEGNLLDEDCDYEVCPYDQTGNTYFKIRKCNEPGYEPNWNKSACVPISCSKAVNQFLAEDGNKEYARFDGKNLLDSNGNVTKSAKYGIVAGNISLSSSNSCSAPVTNYKFVCTSGYCAHNFNSLCMRYDEGGRNCSSSNGGGIIDTDPWRPIDPTPIDPWRPDPTVSYFCCTNVDKVPTKVTYVGQGELGCSSATTYYSPAHLIYLEGSSSSDGVKAMNVACTGGASIRSYSALNGKTNKVKTYGINWTLNGDVEKPLEIHNGEVYFLNANIKAAMKLVRDNGAPNVGNAKATGSNNITSEFISEGYDYDMSRFQVDNQGFDKKVLIKQGSKSSRIAFKASALKVKGMMAFYDSNIDVEKGYIGVHTWDTGHKGDCGYFGCGITHGSSITLYRSKYNLYNANTRYLYMGNRCFLGYGDKSMGSEITVRENGNDRTAYQIVHRYYHQRKGNTCADHGMDYLDAKGNVARTNLCWIDGYVEAKCKTSDINTGVCEFTSLAEHNLKNYDNKEDTDYERNGCMACRGGAGAYAYKDMWLYRY